MSFHLLHVSKSVVNVDLTSAKVTPIFMGWPQFKRVAVKDLR